jgi:ribosomal protein S18 acetylase RimI-like enzyme
VKEKIDRNYLEIKSINALIESSDIKLKYSIELVKTDDFQINKFFYKNVGKKHRWKDRLIWSDNDWIKYISNSKVRTYILKVKDDFAGYFELIFHPDLEEIEIAYFGLLEEYHNKKLGGYLLTTAIKKSFEKKEIKRV